VRQPAAHEFVGQKEIWKAQYGMTHLDLGRTFDGLLKGTRHNPLAVVTGDTPLEQPSGYRTAMER
jgi:hypothetical protein